jgi:hypothetical protein
MHPLVRRDLSRWVAHLTDEDRMFPPKNRPCGVWLALRGQVVRNRLPIGWLGDYTYDYSG